MASEQRPLVKEKAIEIKKLFEKWDSDGSGYIDRKEMEGLAKEIITKEGKQVDDIQEEVEKLIKKMDKDGDGDIGLIEFASVMGLEDEVEGYRSLFEKVDEDGNGYVDHQELTKVLEESRIPHPKREADAMLRTAQKRRGQVLTFDEFVALMLFNAPIRKRPPLVSREPLSEVIIAQLQEVFNKYDIDKNGTIDKKELKELLRVEQNYDATPHELRVLMKRIDLNGDGRLSFAEFIEMMGFKEEVSLYWQAFMKVDTNQNGRIDKNELRQLLESIKVPHPKRESIRILKIFKRRSTLTFDMFVDVMLSY